MPTPRNYEQVAAQMTAEGDKPARMQRVVDALWTELRGKGCSWIGFYTAASGGTELVLAARRDKPACSPIGLHGACGRAFQSRRALVVTDVKHLGDGYIACDPRDRSEAVLPCFDPESGECWGVLDADSHDAGAWSARDVLGLSEVLHRAGLGRPLRSDEIDTV